MFDSLDSISDAEMLKELHADLQFMVESGDIDAEEAGSMIAWLGQVEA